MENASRIRLFLCGDVMTGRGIDQILPHPSDPRLYERSIQDANQYVQLAERVHGSIDAPVNFDYVWGDCLGELNSKDPSLRIGNLETAITKSDEPWPNKAVHYRMNPENLPVLEAADFDCLSLANNHILDWDYEGLEETILALQEADIRSVGAGANLDGAMQPAVFAKEGKPRVLVFGVGSVTSGIPSAWAAGRNRPGVFLIDESKPATLRELISLIKELRHPDDVVILSMHWGSNWGYPIPSDQRRAARCLVDEAGVSILHGHSSHHVRGFEVHNGSLILYGCGDFLTDYEGIQGYDQFRDDLGLMYFPEFDISGSTVESIALTPTRLRRFRIERAPEEDAAWLAEIVERECGKLDERVDLTDRGWIAFS
ncbi:MAG: CapA family protein [Anaerolineales bacterium]